MAASFDSVRSFCLHVLESGDLEAKLVPPRGPGGGALPDETGSAVFVDRPTRNDRIQIHAGADRLPRLGELRDRHARSVCLERFANHELMAVELFAWALLAYPGMPRGLRRALLHVLEEEQGHVRLYVDRLTDLGSGLGQHRLSDYFWQQVPGIRASSNGAASFLCVMGLTFEQANLDFSLLYRDAFRRQGDEPGAAALDRVHHDEIGHVRLAARWLPRIGAAGGARLGGAEDAAAEARAAREGGDYVPADSAAGGSTDVAADATGITAGSARVAADSTDVALYERFLPFPLSAARAKGRRFDVASRRRAGLSEAFIAHVRSARPYVPRVGPAEGPLPPGRAPEGLGPPRLTPAGLAQEGVSPPGSDSGQVATRSGRADHGGVSAVVVHANFGAEEDRDAKRAVPGLLRLLSLWEALLPAGAAVELPVRTFPPGTRRLPGAVPLSPRAGASAPSETVALSPLPVLFASLRGFVPWYPDAAAARRAAELGLPLATGAPEVVARLHDKASCAHFAAGDGHASRFAAGGASPTHFAAADARVPFPALVEVLDPAELRDPGAAARIGARVSSWPRPWGDRFVLKPRFGTSGRGRVHGRGAVLDDAGGAGLVRLADRGGAILEPWVERSEDLSAQYWITADGGALLLGTTRQVLGENGIYLGNRGGWTRADDGALVISSGLPEDEPFRAACARFVEDVVTPELRGPCGIDGFSYRDGDTVRLRPLVELNARFTAGTVALGWLARVLGAQAPVDAGQGVGEWWFCLAPRYGHRLRGAEGAPSPADGWTLVALGRGDDPPVLGLR